MLNITIYKDFIAVNAKYGISKYATEIMKEDYSDGMSGYDIEEFVKCVCTNSTGFDNILNNFTFDSEYGMFCMYYKMTEGITQKVTDADIKRCSELVSVINNLIRTKYVESTNKIDVSVQIMDVRKPNEILESHAN